MFATNSITDKRLRNEIKDLKKNKLDFAQAIQDEENKFIFYFLLKGDKNSDYNGGYYLGKIILPDTYPTKPGDFMMLTPNGRFETNKKICLTNSGYHSESWTPTWNIKNMIIGFVSIFNSDTDTGISHIKDTPQNRKNYASNSISYNLTNYENIFIKFDQFINNDGTIKETSDLHENKPKKKEKKEKKDEKDNKYDEIILEKPLIKLDQSVNNNDDVIDINMESIMDKTNDQQIIEQINTSDKKEENEISNVKLAIESMKTKHHLISQYLENIKNMKYENFEMKPFEEVFSLSHPKLSEL